MIGFAGFRRKASTPLREDAHGRGLPPILLVTILIWAGYTTLRAVTLGATGKAGAGIALQITPSQTVDPAVAKAKLMTDIPAKSWQAIIRNVYNNIDQDRVLAVAGGVAFFVLLAIFPAVTTLVSLYGVITDRAHVAEDLASLSSFLPDGAVSIISEQAIRIASGAPLSLGFAALFSFALATWSANSGMKALMDALNASYGKRETRTFLRVNMTSFALSLGALVFLVLMLSAVAAVPVILEFLWLDRWSQWLVWAGRWPAILILLGLAISVLYRWGPNIKNTSWRWYSPGSVLASVGLLGFSMLFSWYAANLATFNETYGSLGAVIAFLAWMWLSTVVILTGAELNAELDRRLGDRPTLTAPR
jgi:membrane protein